MKKKIIGIVIADKMEYLPLRETVKDSKKISLWGDECLEFEYECGKNQAKILAVLCGIGKVNAAAATANLISRGAEIILNSGLSGGISGVRRGDITLGTKYIEHDFDLTPLKFAPGEKPGQCWVYEADGELLEIFAKSRRTIDGLMVCGDQFIADEGAKIRLRNEFGAVSCDMESAACASVCYKAGVPFLAVRRISDDAADNACEDYSEMNNQAEDTLIKILFDGIEEYINC